MTAAAITCGWFVISQPRGGEEGPAAPTWKTARRATLERTLAPDGDEPPVNEPPIDLDDGQSAARDAGAISIREAATGQF